MKTTINIPAAMGASVIESALEGLARLAADECARFNLPPLYQSGVRYVRERGTENWQTPRETLSGRFGDCEDLAAYRVGELRASGVDPGAVIAVERTGPRTMHAIVRRSDGSIEDPSRALGMGGPADGLAAPILIVGVEPTHTWAEWQRKANDHPIVSGAHIGELLMFNDEGVAGELGFLPVLDVIARAAGGALNAVVPGLLPGQAPAQAAPARAPSPQVAQQVARNMSAQMAQMRSPVVTRAASSADISATDVLSIATALARVVAAEKARDRAQQARERRR